MIRRHRMVLRAVFAAATVSALGFGGTQAFAASTSEDGTAFPYCQSNQDCFSEENCGPSGGICTYPHCFCWA